MQCNTVHDEVRDPHNIRLSHEQLHAALSRAERGRMTVPDSLHGRAFEQNVPHIMHSMQGAVLAHVAPGCCTGAGPVGYQNACLGCVPCSWTVSCGPAWAV